MAKRRTVTINTVVAMHKFVLPSVINLPGRNLIANIMGART